jgi:indole-3-glycerol phosphate synthase
VATYLDRILISHRQAAARDERPLAQLADLAMQCPPPRGFRDAITRDVAGGQVAVIAEVKRRSPSKGALAVDLDPVVLAGDYARGTASCLSVLTDEEWFGGSPADLQAARNATDLPALRKDFTVSVRDVFDARLMGADCLLLIVAALDDDELRRFHETAVDLGLDILVEVHDEPELERALAVGARMVGVNQRDLVSFEVDTDRAVRMAPLIPDDVTRVAESGIGGPADAARLAAAGYDALLVGESLVRSADPAAAVSALRAGAGVLRARKEPR